MMTTSRNWWQLSMRQWRRGALAGVLAFILAPVATPAVTEPSPSLRTPAASTQTTMEATSAQDLKALLATLQDSTPAPSAPDGASIWMAAATGAMRFGWC
jgi:hypothetical protein